MFILKSKWTWYNADEIGITSKLNPMAEMQQQEGNHKKRGGIRSKKLSTKVDLTPMVDLGFLLITFFIFTTTLSEAKVMKLNMPQDSKEQLPIKKSVVLTLIPSGHNKIHYYFEDNPQTMLITNYGVEGLRKLIINKKKEVTVKFGDGQEMVVLIKPTDKSTYQNLVDVLDEMLINNVTRYMLLDINEEEIKLTSKEM